MNDKELHIRPIEPSDKDFYLSIYTNKKIMRNVSAISSIEELSNGFDFALKNNDWQKVKSSYFVACSAKEKIAILGVKKITNQHLELGLLVATRFQMKGYAKEIMIMACNYFFNFPLICKALVVRIAEENLAAQRIARMVGFKKQIPKASNGLQLYSMSHEDWNVD